MTKDEFVKRMNEDEEWAPGWEAIEAEFSRLYPGQESAHFATMMPKRAIFGGDQYLDGMSFYTSPKGYLHLVSFGMTSLYAEEESFGGEYNGWGYEMTMKLRGTDPNEYLWAADMMLNLARYTYTSKRWFENEQFIAGNGSSLHIGTDSAITALITVFDTEAQTLDTIYGETQFIQLVGITEPELTAIKENPDLVSELIRRMKDDGNTDLVTDMNRTKSYL